MDIFWLFLCYGVGWLMGFTTCYAGFKRAIDEHNRQLQVARVRDLNGRNDQR